MKTPTEIPSAKNKKGIALLLVLMVLALIAVLAVEIIFASTVDLRIARNARDRLQAIYLAQSAARFSLLRLHIYAKVKSLGSSVPLPIPNTTIDQIWSSPLPPFPLPGSKIDWPGLIQSQIESESSKIPINLLDGEVHRQANDTDAGKAKVIAEDVKKQVEEFILGLKENEEFDEKYPDLEVKDLVEPLIDWIDTDVNKLGGGDENRDYEKYDPPYGPRNSRIPTLSEIHMIQGWTDDLYNRIVPSFTVYGDSMEINPNYISLDRLRAIDRTLEDSDLMVIQRRRLEEPFKDLAELENFIKTSPEIRGGKGINFSNFKDVSQERTFVILASGVVGDAKRKLKMAVRFEPNTASGAASSNTPGAPAPNPTSTPSSGGNASTYENLKILFVGEDQ